MHTERSSKINSFTFLFTDIEGSTRKWETHPESMNKALAKHDSIIASAIAATGGNVFKTVGDAFCAVFHCSERAIEAVQVFQQALSIENWGDIGELRVRCALHTGPAIQRNNDYFGPTLNRVARILSTAHGGQVLISDSCANTLACKQKLLSDLGEHRLKDLERPEHIYQLNLDGRANDFQPIKSLNRFNHNLPQYHTSFIGRRKEISTIRDFLESNSLVTLRGFGGCGKTRLALHTAAEMIDLFIDGIWLLELNSLSSRNEMFDRLSSVLGFEIPAETDEVSFIQKILRQKKMLLIFDNCEHLIDDVAEIVACILSDSSIKVLTTSRECLRIDGERLVEVLPLDISNGSKSVPEPELPDSVLLFLSRLDRPERLKNSEIALVSDICCKLDGIPLSLELAAGLCSSLSLESINERLCKRFTLISKGKRGAPVQHQSLKAMIDWSYNRLTEDEKNLLRILSVLKWDWTIMACETVAQSCGLDEGVVLSTHSSLVEKSLISPIEDRNRYHLLETIREYVSLLIEKSDCSKTVKQMAKYYLAYTESAFSMFFGNHFSAMEAYSCEYLNMLSLLECLESFEEREHTELYAELICSIYEYWQAANLDREADLRFKHALERIDSLAPVMQAKLLMHRARNLNSLGFYEEAEKVSIKAYGIAKDLDPVLSAWSKLTRGVSLIFRNNPEKALPHYRISFDLFQESDDLKGKASILCNLGGTLADLGQIDEAENMLEQGICILNEIGDTHRVSYLMASLGNIYRARGELDRAERKYLETESHIKNNGWLGFLDLAYSPLAELYTQKGCIDLAASFSIKSLRAVLGTQNLGICSQRLAETAYCLFKTDRCLEGALLLGTSCAINKLLHGKDHSSTLSQLESELCNKDFTPEALRASFTKGLNLDVSEIENYLNETSL